MDELRLVRRDEQSLIVATEAGEEYRLIVDETVLAELRHLSRPSRGARNVNPREVQALVRAGKSREEISQLLGLEEDDIERYEEPVLAERRYILELARKVPVRTSPGEDAAQEFGTAIAERLIGIGAQGAVWSSWRDEEAGWMIGLEFDARDVAHRAVWSFEHRKGLLTPITADATTLSRQGELGDRLIPKLRAVDANERFDSGAFDVDPLPPAPESEGEGEGEAPEAKDPDTPLSPNVAPDHPSTGSIPIVDADAEYARRRTIEERAIKTPETELPDLGQTADLLDALRRRRGERAAESAGSESNDAQSADAPPRSPIPISGLHSAERHDGHDEAGDDGATEAEDSVDEWEIVEDGALFDTSGAKAVPDAERQDDDADTAEVLPILEVDSVDGVDRVDSVDGIDGSPSDAGDSTSKKKPETDPRKRGKGRASIPSWDDILFGTRSEDDPA